LPVFGNGPWVDPVISDPKGFLALPSRRSASRRGKTRGSTGRRSGRTHQTRTTSSREPSSSRS
jgi:hypothetical protein